MNHVTALAGAALIALMPVAAEACDINRIIGTWEVVVSSTKLPGWGSGSDGQLERSTHSTCSFRISRNTPRVANFNPTCEPPLARGNPARHFIQDGVNSNGHVLWPWHQLHRVGSSCTWTLIDLNGIDMDYKVSFSTSGQSLVGQGGFSGPSGGGVTNFSGVKVR